MSKTVVFIQGSPRENGNTRALAALVMETLAQSGVASISADATRLQCSHPGCIACGRCQEGPEFRCHVDDGLARAVATLPDYDAVVLSTPVFWLGPTAQAKMCVDRMASLVKCSDAGALATPLRGKILGLFATGATERDENLDILERQYRVMAEYLGMPFVSALFPFCGVPAGQAAADPEFATVARDFGVRLAGMLGGRKCCDP